MNDSQRIAIAPVRKSILVRTSQARAFEVFTTGLDRWWPKSHYVGPTQVTKDILEPRLGGRWYEIGEDGAETTVGRILIWEPPHRFAFSWEINGDWKPDSGPGSEVEVRFIAEGENSTRVELEHRLFERIGFEGGTKMRNSVDGGWLGILETFKQVAEQ